jgi:glycosyltransferase involved in cell wall biosynthesis
MQSSSRHIAIVAPYFYPKIGGLENYAYNLGKTLVQTGNYTVSVIASNHESKRYERKVVDGMTVHLLPITFTLSNSPINPFWYWTIKKIFREEKPAIVNTHSPVPYMADMAALAAGKIPVIATYHAGSMLKGSLLIDLILSFYEKVFLRLLFRKAKAIVAISEQYLRRTYPEFSHKMHFIPTGVDLSLFAATPLPESKTVSFVGRIEHSSKWKGIEELMQAMSIVIRNHPGARLQLVGGGDAVGHFKQRAQDLSMGHAVDFRGILRGEELREAFRRSSVIVLPSTSDAEAFSVALVEAMASGRPIIGTNIGGTPQVIEDGQNGLLVPPKDPEALAVAINRVLNDSSFAESLAARGLSKVQQFSWDKQAGKYQELFQSVMLP